MKRGFRKRKKVYMAALLVMGRSEERRVGKEC